MTEADDIHVIIASGPDELYVMNLTKIDIEKFSESSLSSPIKDLIHLLSFEANSVSEELLTILRSFKNSWIDTNLNADTAIGRQVEALLESLDRYIFQMLLKNVEGAKKRADGCNEPIWP